MTWTTAQFDWNRARAFLATAEEGTFSAAAEALSTTQPTVGRQVARLEEELGVVLFERVGTRLELTSTGLAILEHVRAMGAAAEKVSMSALRLSDTVEGWVSITASEAISAFLLPPLLRSLRDHYPGIQLSLVVSNTPQDLLRREADIAIRNFCPTTPELVARKIRESHAHFYASQEYLERVGLSAHSTDTDRASFFAFDDAASMIAGFRKWVGLELTPSQFPIATSNHLLQWELCKQGMGVCVMMEEVARMEPSLIRVFPHLPSIPVPLWLVCHRELHTSRRLRVVIDWLAEHL